MTLKFGSNIISETDGTVTFNGNNVNKVVFNDTTIWEKSTTPSGTVIFESAIAGTYTVNIPVTGNYQVIMVGGGGEGGTYTYGTLQLSSYGYGGGYIDVYTNLTVGSYTAIIGGTHKTTPQNTTFNNLQAGGGHIYYTGSSGAQFNVITNNVSDAYQVNQNVTTIAVRGSNYNNYGKGADTYSASGSTPGYIKIIKL